MIRRAELTRRSTGWRVVLEATTDVLWQAALRARNYDQRQAELLYGTAVYLGPDGPQPASHPQPLYRLEIPLGATHPSVTFANVLGSLQALVA